MAKNRTKKEKTARSFKWSCAGLSVFLIVLGACAMIWPEIGTDALCVLIGIVAVVFGIAAVIIYFMRDVTGVAVTYDFSMGLLSLIIGVVMLIHPKGIIDLLQVVIGVFLLFDSILKLQTAVDSKRFGMSWWWVPLIFTAACMVLGVLMVMKVGANILMLLIGAALAADGLQNLCLVIYSGVAARQLKRMDKDGDGMPDASEEMQSAEPESAPAAAAQPPAPQVQVSENGVEIKNDNKI